MDTVLITKDQAKCFGMSPSSKYGIMSEGMVSLWGEGSCIESAKASANGYFHSKSLAFVTQGIFNFDRLLSVGILVQVEGK